MYKRQLTGVYKPTDGTIVLDGKNITGKSTIEINRAGIARTFQNIRLFKEMSVLDNVKVALHNHYKYSTFEGVFRLPRYFKLEKAMDAKALELLKVFELDDKASLLASGLPYGDQRKLEIARALATQPKLLLLDEPAAGMNPNETAELMDTIRFVRDNFDMTVLLIEQNANMALHTADKGYVLETGEIILEGPGRELLENPVIREAYLGK